MEKYKVTTDILVNGGITTIDNHFDTEDEAALFYDNVSAQSVTMYDPDGAVLNTRNLGIPQSPEEVPE